MEISDDTGTEEFEEYLKNLSALQEDLARSFRGQLPSERSLNSSTSPPILSPLISKEYGITITSENSKILFFQF